MQTPLPSSLAVLAASLLFFAPDLRAQSHYYVDHFPTGGLGMPPADSCFWPGCECGSIYPTGPDYMYSVVSGRNYDPSYPDSCETEFYTNCPPMQIEHIYRVDCVYDSATGQLRTGCFTLEFTITQCQGLYGPKMVDKIRIKLRDQGNNCRNDTVNFADSVGSSLDTLAQFIADTANNSTIEINIPNIPPPYPCAKRPFSFEVCDLWKWGHGPAEWNCPTVFEFTLINTDGTECGTIPFVMYGHCVFPGPDPAIEEGKEGVFTPSVKRGQVFRYNLD